MTCEHNLYEVLGIPITAGEDDIRTAYYRKVRMHPPEKDREGFQRIQQAFDVLRNPVSRREYDDQQSSDSETRELVEEARTLLEDGDASAISPLKRALVRSPESLVIRDLLVQAFIMAEEYSKAEKHARTLVQRSPKNAAYHLRLGDVLRASGRDEQAESPFRQAYILDQATPLPVTRLAYLLSFLNRKDEAVQILRTAILRDGRVDFEDFLFFQALCRISISNGDFDMLREIHREIRTIIPPDQETRSFVAWFYFTDAMLLADLKDFGAALQMIEEAIEIDDSLPALKDTYKRISRSKSVLDEITRLAEDERVMPELRFSVGPFVAEQIFGGHSGIEKTRNAAMSSLMRHVLTRNSPILFGIQSIRDQYPETTRMTSGFLDVISRHCEENGQKNRREIRCPGCGDMSPEVQPTIDTLVKFGNLTAEQAAVVLKGEGTQYAKKYLVFSCSKCGTVFNGESVFLRNAPTNWSPMPPQPKATRENGQGCIVVLFLIVIPMLLSTFLLSWG